MSAFSGVPEVDSQFLVTLPYSQLVKLCFSNQYLHSICQDDYFWHQKVLYDFGDAANYKPANENYHQQYQYLMDSLERQSHVEARKGRLDALIAHIQHGDSMVIYDAHAAAEGSHLNVLQWLTSLSPPILPDTFAANAAAMRGRLDILRWMASLKPPVLPDRLGVTYATEGGYLDVLKWLAQYNILPNRWDATAAAERGYSDILGWMAEYGITPLSRMEQLRGFR